MARDPIQFQCGLSLPGFPDQYGSEEHSRAALYRYRWPKGFVCPGCGNATCCQLSRGLHPCYRYPHQTPRTASILFHGTHLPLTIWFLAIYFFTQRMSDISTLQLSRELGVADNTAWKLKRKLLQVMYERNQSETPSKRIGIDDACLGGERPRSRVRGTEHKFLVVAAVQSDEESHPQRVQLHRVSGFILDEIRRYAQQVIAPDSRIISDGLGCFLAFDTPGYVHERHITGYGRASMENPEFNWLNTLLGNVKNAIIGTYHAIGGQHASRYLAEFEYRFNWRYDLKAIILHSLTTAARTLPMFYRSFKTA